MKYLSVLFSLLICLCSCSSTYHVTHDLSSYEKLNQEIGVGEVTMVNRNGEMITAAEIKVSLDSIRWIDSGSGKLSVSTTKIQEIVHQNSWKGAKDGFRIGFVVGAVVGVAGALTNDIEIKSLPPIVSTGMIGLLGGLGYGIIGLPVGAALGHTDRYIFQAAPGDF